MKIYKFRSLSKLMDENGACARDFTIDLLKSHAVWCPRPDSLNDLLEIQPIIDASFDDKALTAFINWSRSHRGWTDEKCHAFKSGYFEAKNRRLIPDLSSFIAEMIANIQTIGVCSFTMNWRVPMIWGTYADNGAGIAIEFVIPDNEVGKTFHKVRYVNRRETLKLCELFDSLHNRKANENIHKRLICTKSKVWSGEEEIRCIVESGNRSASVAGKISKVYLGPKINKADERIIREIISDDCITKTQISKRHFTIETMSE